MDFPAYVPAAVRAHITDLLDGDCSAHFERGWRAMLDDSERKVSDLERKIDYGVRVGRDDYLDQFRLELAEERKHRDRLAGDVDCLHRLAHDARMQAAYTALTAEFTGDHQWVSFIRAAWAARMDFAPYRERLKLADELKGEIAKAADKLAALLDRFGCTGDHGPGEFFSVQALLESTDNHESNDRNLHMWRGMREYIFGNKPSRNVASVGKDSQDSDSPIEIRIVALDSPLVIDHAEETRNTLRYAWGTAPSVSALMRTLAGTARAFTPSESGMIGAAIASQKSVKKVEYLRALGNLLTDVHHFTLTTPIMRAMAVVANVAVNLPGVDATYDDVRKALAKLGGGRLEDLSGKQ